MSPERLEHLLTLVGPHLAKKKCRSRMPISPVERLLITLRYLATGDSQQSQSFNFHVGRATVCHIIKETCIALWSALQSEYLSAPETKEDWKNIAKGFQEDWNYPNCIGALDGKHVAMDCPKNKGSSCYNYKGFHSLVLMAICDSKYCFTLVDIGGYGRDNDAAIFGQSEIGIAFDNNEMNLPEPKNVDGYTLPYVLVSDEIFQLKPWLMKPYPGRNITQQRQIHNYRLSRCRRTIENTFGILAARWRIFRRPIRANEDTVENIIKACVCLHNYLKQTDSACYVPTSFVDSVDASGNIVEGSWRSTVSTKQSSLQPIRTAGSNNCNNNAKAIRDTFKEYFNSESGSVPWQVKRVTSYGETLK